ncbi:hypothetical protein LWI29_031862 [Acer saccharum]|uniref:PGG domain-containing protein n=1 Tax=Acer saccharum TaxID=4024 RepID=A0AA39W0I1_ACESA|nr:hypothetical protein LWI29_031862 [Acer saccharum]
MSSKDQLTEKVELGEEKNTSRGTAMSRMHEFQPEEALLLKFLAETWTGNPLHFACEHGSLRVAMEIAKGKPELVTIANEDGNIAMHLVSARGYVEMVEFLEKLHPGSCLVENKSSMTPLQIAVVNGHSDVIRKLVSLNSESLKKETPKQETIFHLALKNSQSDAFLVLVEESKKLNQVHLLNKKDDEGNTVLRIAAFKRLTDIVELLLNDEGVMATSGSWGANSPDTASQEISMIFKKLPDDEICSSETPQYYYSRVLNRALNRWPVETRNVLLVVLVMIAAAAFTVASNLPDALLKEEIYLSGLTLHATASDFISGKLPTVVYLMVFNSAGFMTSMAVISYLIWPLPLRSILLFVAVCTCIVYIILVGKITPRFWVRVGNFSFSSIYLVWTSAVAFIAFGVTIIKMGKYALLCFRWFLKRDY